MKKEEIKEFITLLEESNLNKFRMKKGDFELELEKQPAVIKTPIVTTETVSKRPSQVESVPQLEESVCVLSPMVGTFYTAPSPKDPPFVKGGDTVAPDTVVCVIEAMKVMNEVKANVSGTIKEVLCKNAQTVEFGTKLFKIE